MRPFLNDIRKVQGVAWDDGTRWDIRVPDAPAPFDEWFPAANVEINEVISNLHTFEVGQTEFSIPRTAGQLSLTVTFYDSVSRVLINWLKDWVWKEIHNEGRGVTPVLDAVKPIEVAHIGEDGSMIEFHRYEVIPSGTLTTTLSSTPELQTRSLEFVIINST